MTSYLLLTLVLLAPLQQTVPEIPFDSMLYKALGAGWQ
jgi:hypothetical protein